MPLLELVNVKKNYMKGETIIPALRGIDLLIEKGDFLSIVGPSGSGKSTLLNVIGCIDTPTQGSVLYDGTDLSELNDKEKTNYRKENISFIFQSFNLIPVLTARENVELPLIIEKKFNKEEIHDKVTNIIEIVGLGDMADRFPRELSGGQEQRVAIARALVKNPLVVLADEPTANLDSEMSEDIISVMRKMNEEIHTTFIFSTHDPLVEKHARRVIILRDGLIASDERKNHGYAD
ncbi:MAG TPA: ABC transporter ATP-binding protein [Candidatus Cloacimonetes bacterium]|nr:ABC transporter ATP-binding protein [Candidatus Cloacimonadota bacterium]HEX37946.1 ABC transporter ATP-binding protein [Candidatus Cloacimonadota bacterium]